MRGRCSLLCPVLLAATTALAEPVWVVDPQASGADLPPVGRSLFDHLFGAEQGYRIPFPFERLLERIAAELDTEAYLDQPIKRVLIPLGRSLQRDAAAPDFFASPRAVAVADAEPRLAPGRAGLQLRDRLYVGYMEAADVLEVISYNEAAGRFEFQVVRDYRADGDPQVRYAPRRLCTACHQNGAPIFARPLWDETHANSRVRDALRAQRDAFYAIPLDGGIDIAYAFDNATDRANGFSLTHRLWAEGCGDGADGRRCRGALLARALQFALSDRRGFDDRSPGYLAALEHAFARNRATRFGDGLLLPDADIPNRRPLADKAGAPTDIPARVEPLAPRPPQALWNPPDRDWVVRAVVGAAEFVAGPDLVRLDAHLRALDGVASRSVAADCAAESIAQPGRTLLKLHCTGDEFVLGGRLHLAKGGVVGGRIERLEVDGDALGVLAVAGEAADDGRLVLGLGRAESPLAVRVGSGAAIESLVVEPAAAGGGRRVQLALRGDFTAVQRAIDALAARNDDVFGPTPLRRAVVVGALFEELGMAPLAWCCVRERGLPPAIVEKPVDEERLTALAPFYEVCGRCHRSESPFPPNFLAGGVREVAARVTQCGPRIKFRLGMWELAAERRAKTPMPPQAVLAELGESEQSWRSGTLDALRRALDAELAQRGRPLPGLESLLAQDYATLPPCLPEP